MKILRLAPDQIAITLDNEAFKKLLRPSPALVAEGFEIATVEGSENAGWLIMLKKGDGPPSFSQGPEWERIKAWNGMPVGAGCREQSGQKPEDAGSSPAPATKKGV